MIGAGFLLLEGGMVHILDESLRVSVPGWVTEIQAFRRWTDEGDLP